MKKIKKRHMISALLILIFILSIATNPTKQEYLQFIGWEGTPESIHIQLERVNFFMFSTYTPIVAHESGITHLGIFGHFYQISDGQFDYPWWLEFFNLRGSLVKEPAFYLVFGIKLDTFQIGVMSEMNVEGIV